MVEMIVVILIVGVLAAVAVPRLLSKGQYQAYAFNDEAIATVRYAQKVAIAQRRLVYVVVTSAAITACYVDATCSSPVPSPHTTGAGLRADAPTGTTLSPATSFNFNGLGQPSFGSALTLTMTGNGTRQFTIEADTGFVHP